ncbi:MAG: precorrin-8X methylmutase [Alphaproteobacteria bacterium]|nr:precorrin-8X methylmutase [Alphaproteobacteria bacterium]
MSDPAPDYLRDPQAIYAESFAAIRAEADLSGIPEELHRVALRIAHAIGDAGAIADLTWSDGAVEAGREALERGAPVLADSRMVADGIIRARLPGANRVVCTLPLGQVAGHAARGGTTRSAAAVDLWVPFLDGAVVAIGNAPTALFRLLEGLASGWPKPALIVGMPVGFVGAAESKAALIDRTPAPYICLHGRRGGSAVAAATVNALCGDAV